MVPVMLVELGTSILLSFGKTPYSALHQTGLGIVVMIWLITFFKQVPLHEKLSAGYREELVQKLVSSNRWRTFLWSIKSILGIYMLVRIISM